MADEKIRLSQKEVKTFNELKAIGGVHFPVFKDNINYYKLPLSEIKQIKDNAYDDVTDPVRPNNITDIEQLTFVRNVGADANYTMVESEARIYGVLIPHPSMEADIGKVPMYKNGNQIEWETVPNEESVNDQISSAVQNLQSKLTFDTTPIAGSTNPVISGGIKTALDAKQDVFTIIFSLS